MKHPFIWVALTLLLTLKLSAQTTGPLTAIAGNDSGNQIYINQITTGGTMNFVQNGGQNRIGSFALPSDLTGDNVFFEMRQVGNSNNTDFSITGANNLKLLSVVNGDANGQRIYFNGASNNINALITGNSNKLLINNDTTVNHDVANPGATDKATFSTSDMQLNVAGNNNNLSFGITNATNNYIKFDVTGNTNNIKTTQIGNAGTGTRQSGHYIDLTLVGGSNNLTVYQQGTVQQYLQYNLTGSSNTVNIMQTATIAPTFTFNGSLQGAPQGPAQGTATFSNPGP